MEKMLSLDVLNNVSEIDVTYKRKVTVRVSERPLITTSADCYKILLHYWDPARIELLEEFKVLYLNRSNRVLQIFSASRGGITATVADPRVILAVALKITACNLVLAHNHPSGSVKPSNADKELTQKIKCAAQFHDIKLLDHVIVSLDEYYSFADEGLV